MAKTKSLVYLDNVVQRALKDILIPILGYRDTSKTLGQYTSELDYVKKDITALQVPDKDKIYVHEDMTQPITIFIPDKAYDGNGSSYEDVKVYIEFKAYSASEHLALMAAEIVIPGGIISQNLVQPYCAYCSQPAHDELKTAYVKVMRSIELNPSNVVQIYFPNVNVDTISQYSRGVVTVSSQNRDVKKVESWNGITGTEQHIVNSDGFEIPLGAVSTFDDISDKDKLVRSNSIRAIEGITSSVQEYLIDADKTDVNTAYFEIESPDPNMTGTLRFESAAEVQAHKDILLDVFGHDWSNIRVEFADNVKDISGAFKGFTFKQTPFSITGNDVEIADALFKGSNIEHISSQLNLLRGMPKLMSINSMFENTPLTDTILEDIIAGNPRLSYMNFTFRHTNIKNTAKFWEMTRTYVPDRDPDTSSLLPNPTPVTVNIEGNGCFEGVSTLPSSLNIPTEWKTASHAKLYNTYDEFIMKRSALLAQYDNDLSQVSITIKEQNISLDSMFAETKITKAPKEIVVINATSIARMFFMCSELIDIKPSCIAQLNTATSANSFLAECAKLTTLDQSIFEPFHSIDDFSTALTGLTNITGPSPLCGGKHLWELAGTPGYPSTIYGSSCFEGSTFDDMADIPQSWGGLANA